MTIREISDSYWSIPDIPPPKIIDFRPIIMFCRPHVFRQCSKCGYGLLWNMHTATSEGGGPSPNSVLIARSRSDLASALARSNSDIYYVDEPAQEIEEDSFRKITSNSPMGTVLVYLPKSKFKRINRSYAVNMDYVTSINGKMLFLGKKQLSNLKMYKGLKHPHESQNPEIVNFAKKNLKNKITIN